jgi:hypothetical protein
MHGHMYVKNLTSILILFDAKTSPPDGVYYEWSVGRCSVP